MPKIIFGLSNENVDPSEYRDGMAASVKDCYRVQIGQDEHFRKRSGLSSFADSGTGKVTQGRYETFGEKVIEVIGGIVYELSATGVLTAYTGDVLNEDIQCIFTEDFSNVFVAHGGRIAKLDTNTKTVSLLGANTPENVTHIAYAQGFLLCNGLVVGGIQGDTNYSDDVSNGYNATGSWEVFNNERLPDGCNSLFVGWDAEIYSFGPKSVEVSYNDGSTPWAVLQGAYMQYGLLAPYSVATADNTLFWLTNADSARRIVKMVNRAPSVISGPYDRLLNDMDVVDDAMAWIQQIDGYSFYIITFPTEEKTLAYKLDDGSWSELGFYNITTASYEAYLGHNSQYITAWNKTLIGSRIDSSIYEQSGLSDGEDAIRMELTSGQMESGTFQTKIEKMLLWRVKKGYEEGGTFQYRLRDNNGQWKNEKSLSLNALGSTKPYIKTPSGGSFRSRQYQVIHSDVETDFIFIAYHINAFIQYMLFRIENNCMSSNI